MTCSVIADFVSFAVFGVLEDLGFGVAFVVVVDFFLIGVGVEFVSFFDCAFVGSLKNPVAEKQTATIKIITFRISFFIFLFDEFFTCL